MVSNRHRLLLRKGRNNRSNSDFQTFFEEFIMQNINITVVDQTKCSLSDIYYKWSFDRVYTTSQMSNISTFDFVGAITVITE